jgi:hypothetical protein
MITKPPNTISDGVQLSPSLVEDNIQFARRLVKDAASKKLVGGSFLLPYYNITESSSSAHGLVQVNPTHDMIITHIELVCSDTDVDLTSIGLAIQGAASDTMTVLKGERGRKSTTHSILAGESVSFICTASGTGAYVLQNSYARIHYVTWRSLVYSLGYSTNLESGDLVEAGPINSALSDIQSAVDEMNSNPTNMSIEVIVIRSPTLTGTMPNTKVTSLPACGHTLKKAELGACGSVGTTLSLTISLPTPVSVTRTCLGVSTQAIATITPTSPNNIQTNIPGSSAADWLATTDITLGTNFWAAVVVLYWN